VPVESNIVKKHFAPARPEEVELCP
jgi:hypothetical protein